MSPVQFFATNKDVPDAVRYHCSGYATMRDAWISDALQLPVALWLAWRVAGLPPVLAFDMKLIVALPRGQLKFLYEDPEMAGLFNSRSQDPATFAPMISEVLVRARHVINTLRPVDRDIEARCLKWLRQQCPCMFALADDPGAVPVAAPVNPFMWTAERPTVVGWYWARRRQSMDDKPEIVQVRKYAEKLAIGNCALSASGYADYEWAGPIPEPTEGV